MKAYDRIRSNFQRAKLQIPTELSEFLESIDRLSTSRPLTDEDCHTLHLGVCRYLDGVALRHKLVGEALGRTVAPPLADVVTEALNVAIQTIVESIDNQGGVTVHSEKSILGDSDSSKRPRKKPDISIRRGDELCLVIECKTNLGYNRAGWRNYYEDLSRWYERLGLVESEVVLLVASEANINADQGLGTVDTGRKEQWLSLSSPQSWFGVGSWRKLQFGRAAGEEVAADDDEANAASKAHCDLADGLSIGTFATLRDLIIRSLARSHRRSYPEGLSQDMSSVMSILRRLGPSKLVQLRDSVFDNTGCDKGELDARYTRIARALGALQSDGLVAQQGKRGAWQMVDPQQAPTPS